MFKMHNTKLIYIENSHVIFTYDLCGNYYEYNEKIKGIDLPRMVHHEFGDDVPVDVYLDNLVLTFNECYR